MDSLNRAETLQLLSFLGVEIPPKTKLSNEALDKRLRQAINAIQSFSRTIRASPLDLSLAALPSWPTPSSTSDASTRRVLDAIKRGNFHEALQRHSLENPNHVDLYKDAFMDIRQTLMSLGHAWDEGHKVCVIQDVAQEESAINIRLLSVRKVDDKTPLILITYQAFTKENPWPAVAWLREQMEADERISSITATQLEQKFLLKILAMNAKHLPVDFKPQKTATEKDFAPSFLLPIGPLTYEDVGKLNADTGCAVCGEKTTSKCKQCLSVLYCGKDCQLADWPTHKRACRSLKGGTWHTIPITYTSTGMGFSGVQRLFVNRFEFSNSDTGRMRVEDADVPPPNIHGTKMFLIKMQLGGGNMLIYDRQRSFEVCFFEWKNPEVFRAFRAEMQGPRGGYQGLKMYRWAKRVGEWELSVCLDREPQDPIKW